MEKNKKRQIRNIIILVCAAVVVACGVLLIVPCGNVAAGVITFAGAIGILGQLGLAKSNDRLVDRLEELEANARVLQGERNYAVKCEVVAQEEVRSLRKELENAKAQAQVLAAPAQKEAQEEPKAKRVIKRSGSKKKISEIKATVHDISENIQK